jgi:hypothetical protein
MCCVDDRIIFLYPISIVYCWCRRVIYCCWSSPVSGPAGIHGHVLVLLHGLLQCFKNGASSSKEEGLVIPSRSHLCCNVTTQNKSFPALTLRPGRGIYINTICRYTRIHIIYPTYTADLSQYRLIQQITP